MNTQDIQALLELSKNIQSELAKGISLKELRQISFNKREEKAEGWCYLTQNNPNELCANPAKKEKKYHELFSRVAPGATSLSEFVLCATLTEVVVVRRHKVDNKFVKTILIKLPVIRS